MWHERMQGHLNICSQTTTQTVCPKTFSTFFTATYYTPRTMLQISLYVDPTIITTSTHSFITTTIPSYSISSDSSLAHDIVLIKLDRDGKYKVRSSHARITQAHIETRTFNASLTGTLDTIPRSGVCITILLTNTAMEGWAGCMKMTWGYWLSGGGKYMSWLILWSGVGKWVKAKMSKSFA